MKILEHNIETGEAIERDATPDEVKYQAALSKNQADAEKAEADKAAAKTALLERLGITADEAALLIP